MTWLLSSSITILSSLASQPTDSAKSHSDKSKLCCTCWKEQAPFGDDSRYLQIRPAFVPILSLFMVQRFKVMNDFLRSKYKQKIDTLYHKKWLFFPRLRSFSELHSNCNTLKEIANNMFAQKNRIFVNVNSNRSVRYIRKQALRQHALFLCSITWIKVLIKHAIIASGKSEGFHFIAFV